MNQFLSNKIISGIVALALLVGVGVLVSSGDTSSTTRNAALVAGTPCPKPGQVTKISKQSVVCATTNTGSLWYATMKAKGKAQACAKPGAIRKKSKIVWVCGVVKKKKLWQATQPLSALAAKGDLPSTTPATPDAPVVADNAVLADPAAIDTAATQTLAPAVPAALSLVTQPSGGVNALALETQPVVQLLDQRGASISTAGVTITAVSGRTDVVLSGNTAVTDATGRAVFKTLSLTGIMGDIALTFTASGLEGVTSRDLDLAPGVAIALVSDTKLGAAAAGQRFNQFHKLHLEDSSGNVVAGAGRNVVVSSSTEGLSGTTTVPTAKDGYVLFKNLMLTQTGTTTLTFTSGDLSTTSTVMVKPGDSQGLKITTEVSEVATNNIAFAQSPVVQLLDADGNTVTTAGITVTATITQFPAGATAMTSTPFSSTAVTNAQGVAIFTGLGITGLIGDYILGFTPDKGVTRASDKTVTLSAGEPKKLIVFTAPSSPEGNSDAGTWSLTQSPVIGLRDVSNNPVEKENVTVTATLTGQDPTFSADTDDQGKAVIPITFSGDSAGLRTITYKASNVINLRETINLPPLTPVVTRALTVPTDKNTTSENFQLTAPTSNSDGAWTYTSSNAAIATVTSAGAVTPTGVAGSTTITATQAATSKYESATSTATLVIGLTTPTVNLKVAYSLGKNTTSLPFNPIISPTSDSDGAWTYSGLPATFATVDARTGAVTPRGVAGTTTITATQAATSKYESATSTANLVIALPTPVVTRALTVPTDKNTTSENFQLTAPTSNSDGAWTYSGLPATFATVTSAGAVTPTGVAGSTTITATQAATSKYESATSTATLVITKGYQVGDGGPGGGSVFYVAPTPFKCGVYMTAVCTYLEAATAKGTTTSTWTPSTTAPTTAQWGCLGINVFTDIQRTASVEIGRGLANTILITGASCNVSTSAASIANAYNGGGKADWFLPSKKELNELCKYARTQTTGNTSVRCNSSGTLRSSVYKDGLRSGYKDGSYWSSSENHADTAWFQSFWSGEQFGDYKDNKYYVRPVRAF